MTREEKKEFVKNLTESVARHIIQHIDCSKIPDEWDGIELRWLLEMEFKGEATFGKRNGRRRREFLNTVNVNNL